MGKVDYSIWRCTYRSVDQKDGYYQGTKECDQTIIQQEMEAHLVADHNFFAKTPEEVLRHFVLVRTADVRGPGRRGKTTDITEPLFDKGDFT